MCVCDDGAPGYLIGSEASPSNSRAIICKIPCVRAQGMWVRDASAMSDAAKCGDCNIIIKTSRVICNP